MQKTAIVTLLTIITTLQGISQKAEHAFVVVSYNVENLFEINGF